MRTAAKSIKAQQALLMLSTLQNNFMQRLQSISERVGQRAEFKSIEWLRDAGEHGGGLRFEASEGSIFNRASINVSQVQYENRADKSFSSATALSTIIHPSHPLAPSVHLHISWTELKNKRSYWRLMADLNPSIAVQKDTEKFDLCLKAASGEYYQQGAISGDEYFYIPALQCSRGVSHFYLEGFNPENINTDDFAKQFGGSVIQCYSEILQNKLLSCQPPTSNQQQSQLDYHTLYFYQVLTLDKGTTAGLLVHNQNDIGTLGSLPAHINRELLASWVDKTPAPQDKLIIRLLKTLPKQGICLISGAVKMQIAEQIREHYKQFPLNKKR
ncbi:coproporphyrinogen III oxidase [Psychromonas sp.]|uniref:coproporphyrinogen III oxidase n=1 Tax=Psychromonas sp. TaxID=1884585 RepID=UPI003562ED57